MCRLTTHKIIIIIFLFRYDEPTRVELNEVAAWVDKNFKWDTRGLVVVLQAYWEPIAAWDSFGTVDNVELSS
jgi:hypothetical protein